MSAQVLVSRPRFDTQAISEEQHPKTNDVAVNTGVFSSSGVATAGYRTAKYTTEEWFQNNQSKYFQAFADRDNAENIRHQSKKMSSETEATTMRTQSDSTKKLGERLQDIFYWKSELQREIEDLTSETDLLLGQKTRLEKALDATEIPQAIATDNLQCRERRVGSDLVKDSVEVELLNELDLIRSVQELLKRTLDQAINQIRSNREAKQTLELDWSDKYEAYNIDDKCGRYNNQSTDIQYHMNSAKFQDHISHPESLTEFTCQNISSAVRERLTSIDLRGLVDKVIQDTAHDLRDQCAAVDRALAKRCEEMNAAKVKMEQHLDSILNQIGAQEKNIAALHQAIRNKEAPMKVAQTRLYDRSSRTNMELCRDHVQLRLVNEVGEITESIESLQRKYEEAKQSLSNMEDTRMMLEKEISNKVHSLFIDREKCMTHRTRYPTVIRLTGY
ncbi:tektin-4 [Acipenser oxyrinchus oxyrinchus]|uniref:Tektin n=1 Tax=Acipenser oxyrinchus oxyrinchus TaxID=40147 RepID=A0AAD8DBM5_ACIOX|nr:tektin-4 [Acipenser oxyrinchus oxyrinchus]